MIEAPARFGILRNMWNQRLPSGCDPINDGTFHTLHIIGMGPIYAFLNLKLRSVGLLNEVGQVGIQGQK